MQVLADYVQQQIRYVAIEVGIGGLQPHPAADVFKHQYGDCKDKVTLLSTMLKQVGIDSYYVMVDTHRGIVNPDFPSLRGNHMIMAIRLPQDVPTNSLYAAIDDPQLGRLLFFDPTDPYVPLGYLPSDLQQNYGLLMTADSGKMILLPLLPPPTNRLLRTATLTLGPDWQSWRRRGRTPLGRSGRRQPRAVYRLFALGPREDHRKIPGNIPQ